MTSPLKVLFLSRLFSPFQVEVGEAVRALAEVDYRVLFSDRVREARGQPHWLNFDFDGSRYEVKPDEVQPLPWLVRRIEEIAPDVIICGQLVGDVFGAIGATITRLPYALGFWLEPTDFTRPLYYRTATIVAVRARLAAADFILAIGDTAESYYRAHARQAEVSLVPYGEDLSHCFSATPEDKAGARMRFLFSGQLRQTHNIGFMIKAAEYLSVRHGTDAFEVILSGSGPEEAVIRAAISRSPSLGQVIRWDREFLTWADRLRPFRYSHVMMYPCAYTGWGLVVPEAMAAGVCVISSRNAGASRYFIRHRVNGIFIEPAAADLAREMEWCLSNPAAVRDLGLRARVDAHDGDAPAIARRLVDVVRRVAVKRRRRDRLGLASETIRNVLRI